MARKHEASGGNETPLQSSGRNSAGSGLFCHLPSGVVLTDRLTLIEWVRAEATRVGGEFYSRCLDILDGGGDLSPAQEAAIRRSRKAAIARAERDSPVLADAKVRRIAAGFR